MNPKETMVARQPRLPDEASRAALNHMRVLESAHEAGKFLPWWRNMPPHCYAARSQFTGTTEKRSPYRVLTTNKLSATARRIPGASIR